MNYLLEDRHLTIQDVKTEAFLRKIVIFKDLTTESMNLVIRRIQTSVL